MPKIPERLFMYWADGFANAPDVVKLAVRSWEVFNPDLELVLLDDTNLKSWTGEDARVGSWEQFDLQKKSDLVRMLLISRHGGFWADSTLVCARPLEEWLDVDSASGVVFLRTQPGKNRFIQSFFLGAQPGSPFMLKWLDKLERLLQSGATPMTNATMRRWQRRRPLMWSHPVPTALWSLPLVARTTGYPYLVPHYLANRLILTSPLMAWKYLRTPQYFAGEALHFQSAPDGVQAVTAMLERGDYPLWKLTWRMHIEPDYWSAISQLFFDHIESNS